MARVLSQPLDLHRFSLTSALMRRSKLLYFLVHVSLCRFSPTPTQSTCLYYYHDNEASKCAGFPRAQVLHCGDPPPGPCCPLRPSKTPARSSETARRPESQVGYRCGMVGNGTCDAPALKRADVGIAVQVPFATPTPSKQCVSPASMG
jgi:hypothetical protein